jgi:shikimate kinase
VRDNIILTGFMGAGKSTIGQRLAERLGFAFVETDRLIEERAGRSIPDIFTEDGEPTFRELEHEVVASLLGATRTVISTGGGVVLRRENRAMLERIGMTVTLHATVDALVARLAGTGPDRPLLADGATRERIAVLLRERMPLYASARYLISTDGMSEEAVVAAILHLWEHYQPVLAARGEVEEPTR